MSLSLVLIVLLLLQTKLERFRRFEKVAVCSLVANSVSVLAVGSTAMAHFSCAASERSMLKNNLYVHVIPALVSTMILINWKAVPTHRDIWSSVALLTCFQLLYCAVPYEGSFHVSKIAHVYGTEPVLVCSLLMLTQFVVLGLLSRRT